MAKVTDMTSGPCMPLILKFALPLLLGNMLQQTYMLVDAAIVGQTLGINALAAVGAGSSVIFLILGFCNGCCGGFAIPVAQKFGARDYRSMRHLVRSSLKITAVASVAIAIVTCLLCPHILQWMQTPDQIFDDANTYLIITFAGIPATFYYNLLSSIIRALGDSTTPFWFLLFSHRAQHCARPCVHNGAPLGRGRCGHSHRGIARTVGSAVLRVHVDQV